MPSRSSGDRAAVFSVSAALHLPTHLVLAAVGLAREYGLPQPAEAHLIVASLKVPLLSRALGDIGIDSDSLLSALESHLGVGGPVEFGVEETDGGTTVSFAAGLATIGARASVLAALPTSHSVDPVDVFLATIFDPLSVTSRELERSAGLDRQQAASALAALSQRYGRLSLPPSRAVLLPYTLRTSWDRRDDVARTLRQHVPPHIVWRCRRDASELIIEAETDDVRRVLTEEGMLLSSE